MNVPIPADNRILYFERERDSFRYFSHFHPSPIQLDGETWPTVEHYYQAQRSDDPAYRQAIRETVSPGKVKHLSLSPEKKSKGVKRSWFLRNNRLPRADWKKVKLEIMRKADWAKFTQNAELREILLATGDAELIEDSPWDAFWGIGPDGNGSNWAGKVLMEIRAKLRAEKTSRCTNDKSFALSPSPMPRGLFDRLHRGDRPVAAGEAIDSDASTSILFYKKERHLFEGRLA